MRGIDEVIEFLHEFAEAECRANCASYAEPDDRKLVRLVGAWNPIFAGGLRSDLSRPDGNPPELYARPEHIAATARQKPRSIFAVARYQHGRAGLYRGWMGDTELGPRGEGMCQNLYVSREQGQLKVAARYEVCSNCLGAATLPDGQGCPACDGARWFHCGGTQWHVPGRILEIRKLQAPTDPRYQRAYDAIGEP